MSKKKTEKDSSLKDLRDSMVEDGAIPNFEGAVYLAEGVWINPDGSLSAF